MKRYLTASVAAAALAGTIALNTPVNAATWGHGRVQVEPHGKNCYIVSFTRSAENRAESLRISREGLKTHVIDLIQRKGWRRSTTKIRAKRAKPNPSMRDSVPKNEFFKPDHVTSKDYTQCWTGVVAPAICTAGSLVCK